MKSRAISGVLAGLFAAAAMAFAADANPNMGTWKLNEAKSKFAPGAQKNHTVVYATDGRDWVVLVYGVDKDGKPEHNAWKGRFDGADYPVTGDPNYDMRSYTVVDPNTLDMVVKKDGKVVGTGKISVSKDGKTRTVTTKGVNAGDSAFNNFAVYDKQ